jgi:hypothetical protein
MPSTASTPGRRVHWPRATHRARYRRVPRPYWPRQGRRALARPGRTAARKDPQPRHWQGEYSDLYIDY